MNSSNKLIFSIKDEMYLTIGLLNFILGLSGLLLIHYNTFFLGKGDGSFGNYIAIILIGRGITKITLYFKNPDKKIEFYSNSINLPKQKIELDIEEIKGVYKISSLFFLGDSPNIKRYNLLAKIFFFLLLPIFIFLQLLIHIFFTIYYRKLYVYNMLVIVPNDEKKIVSIQIPIQAEDKEEKLSSYFKNFLNIDISELETKLFIPKKGY